MTTAEYDYHKDIFANLGVGGPGVLDSSETTMQLTMTLTINGGICKRENSRLKFSPALSLGLERWQNQPSWFLVSFIT